MSILKVNEVQVFNGSTVTITATTTAASGAVTVGGNLAVSGAISSSNASTTRSNLGLAIDSDIQSYSAGLSDIGALTKTDGNFIVGNGTNWVAENPATARESLLPAYSGNGSKVLALNSGATDVEWVTQAAAAGLDSVAAAIALG